MSNRVAFGVSVEASGEMRPDMSEATSAEPELAQVLRVLLLPREERAEALGDALDDANVVYFALLTRRARELVLAAAAEKLSQEK